MCTPHTQMAKNVMQLAMLSTQQLVLLLWLLHAPAAAAALTTVAAPAPAGQRAGCPSKCGDVDIPYPFGIGDDCAWPGFNVSCNHSFTPPRLYIAEDTELIDVSLETGEMRIYAPMVSECYTSPNTRDSQGNEALQLNLTGTPFLVATKRNEFTAIGCGTMAFLNGREDASYLTGCITTCASLNAAAHDGEPCTGLGCCQVSSIPPNLTTLEISWNNNNFLNVTPIDTPCSYAFVAEKGWYNFSRQDVGPAGSKDFITNHTWDKSVPTVLDWAIRRNGSCSSITGLAPACVSAHSSCVNASNGEGYLCKCSKGYAGNPYVTGGCININECEQYPCRDGTCHDLDGGYECKCGFNRKKDRENDNVCQPILSKSAIVVMAIIISAAVLSVAFVVLHMEHEKKKLQDTFKRNGGHILEHLGIKMFTKEELKKITKNYSTTIGEGNFGKVYKGTTDDNQEVAVKCFIKVDEANINDFANEVGIQSRISHKNVVRLVGCCWQTDDPTLVFEYVRKGSLYDVLHCNGVNCYNVGKLKISLEVRLGIAIAATEALVYLHTSANQKVLHGDVKSSNILIDDEFMPKVADFGISRILPKMKHHTNLVIGDRNYMDPIYFRTGLLTEKSDVYSFGIVLLELITRKKAKYDENKSLQIDFVTSYKTDTRAREMFDNEITSPEVIRVLDMISRIAFQCLKEDVDERPTMEQVLEQLHSVRKELVNGCKDKSIDQIDG